MRNRGFEIISSFKDKHINLPTRKTSKSAGYDIEAAEDKIIKAGQMAVIATALVNSTGIIDSDYYNNEDNEGHIMIGLINFGDEDVEITKGMRIAQAIFYKFLTIDDEKNVDTIRSGGFGSTGE